MLLEGPSFKSQRSFPDGTRKEMTTSFVVSKDGTRIAYDKTGTGRAVVLLHGGGQSRRVWHDNGYVARLSDDFTVIVVDIRDTVRAMGRVALRRTLSIGSVTTSSPSLKTPISPALRFGGIPSVEILLGIWLGRNVYPRS